ncbi:MAG TPA: CHAP domain-containing protein [Candidatus Saccharimonadales bacterium]|nr:CHAP domain-containing protein [Candidatus Saccharimonadales bacterium]
MHKTQHTRVFFRQFRRKLVAVPCMVAVAVLLVSGTLTRGFGVFAASCTSTADCQQQIDALNSANNQVQNSLNQLEAQAGSYQAAIAALQAQINSLQAQINTNQAQQAQLQTQIDDAQTKLDYERKVLGEDLKAMYVSGQMSTVEMLATSQNLSSFVDAATYSSAVQNKIQETMQQIAQLQNQLKGQKAQVDQLLASLSQQQNTMNAAQNEQNRLLSLNESQQNELNGQLAANRTALSQLYAQQARIIAASFGGGFHYGGTGGYPYSNAVCLNAGGDCGPYSVSPYNWGINGYPYDGAGWAYRNCTSYAFWRLAQTSGITLYAQNFTAELNSYNGGIKYSVLGWNGSQGDFQRMGYRVDKDPSGSAVLAVQTLGTYGHIMYVEGVVNGDAVVSQYNAAGDGLYSTGTLTNTNGIYFVHIR